MAKALDGFRNSWNDGISQIARHPIQSLLQFAAGVAVPGGSLLAGQAFDARNRSVSDKSTAAWLARNGGVPADLGGNGTGNPGPAPVGAAPLLGAAMPPSPNNNSGYGYNAPNVTGQALADFTAGLNQRIATENDALGAQITNDTLSGNYTRQQGSAPRNNSLASFNAGATGGSDARSGFSQMTGSARSTNDVGGVLAALADLGGSGTGNRAFLGLGALQEAARNGDENARMLLRQRRADREFNSNQ